ncbi:MAG: hypothetical protein M3T55_00485 [Pseudomonadota bacterium]|nr:hypothetical protein [Pseudomonadota bacterium]
MDHLGSSPFGWIRFDEHANLKVPVEVEHLKDALAQAGVTDLVVLSHGWQTDRRGAKQLYSRLWANVSTALRGSGRDPAKVIVAGVLWPSKPYNANYDGGAALVGPAAVGGGALSVEAPGQPSRLSADGFQAVLDDTRALLGSNADPLLTAARTAVADAGSAYEFFEAALSGFALNWDSGDPELRQEAGFFASAQTREGAQALLSAYSRPLQLPLAPGVGWAQGLGGILNGALQGVENGVAWILNELSYFAMKRRAGLVGNTLGSKTLELLAMPPGIRLHLVGHSFGGRLVTAAVNALPATGPKAQSLTLLQGAYSHNGMTAGKGPYSAVPGQVVGPIVVTHTRNDFACTVAYPLASRLSGETTLGLGDKNDPFGAMGANGPQLPASFLAPDVADDNFAPVAGKVNRFLADNYIMKTAETDAHNNVYNPTCGKLVAAAIR